MSGDLKLPVTPALGDHTPYFQCLSKSVFIFPLEKYAYTQLNKCLKILSYYIVVAFQTNNYHEAIRKASLENKEGEGGREVGE